MNSTGEYLLPHLDGVTEVVQTPQESIGSFGLVPAVEMLCSEVFVLGPVAEHVVRGGEHRGRDRHDRFLGTAPGL